MNISLEDLGLEAIEFQANKLLFTELTIFCNQLKAVGLSDTQRLTEILKSMSKVTHARTGLLIDYVIRDVPGATFHAMASLHQITKDHPHLHPRVRRMFDQGVVDIDYFEALSGTIDLKNGKVTGSFSNIPNYISLTSDFITTDTFTGEELAAFILHEQGHIFTYFEFLVHAIRTNYVMYEISRTWTESADKNLKVTLLGDIEKALDTKFEDKAALAGTEKAEIVGAVVAAKAMDRVRKEINTNYYDKRAVEALCDQHVARHGGARALVTGLDKLERATPFKRRHSSYNTTTQSILINALSFAMVVVQHNALGVAVGALLGQTVPFVATVSARGALSSMLWGLGASAFLTFLKDSHPMSRGYDAPIDRFNSIRRDVVNSLKNTQLPDDARNQLLQDILAIDSVVSTINGFGPLTKALYSYIYDTLSGSRKELKFQREYEELANNELYVKAAQFNQLS